VRGWQRVLFSFLGRSFFPFTAGGRVATARPPAHDLSLTSGRALLQLLDGYPVPTDRSRPASEPDADWAVSGHAWPPSAFPLPLTGGLSGEGIDALLEGSQRPLRRRKTVPAWADTVIIAPSPAHLLSLETDRR
jgi:hypothetical protein